MGEEYLQLNGLKCDVCRTKGVWYVHETIIMPNNSMVHVSSCGGNCGTIGLYHTATGSLRNQVNILNELRGK